MLDHTFTLISINSAVTIAALNANAPRVVNKRRRDSDDDDDSDIVEIADADADEPYSSAVKTTSAR